MVKKQLTLSIVIPAYNEESHLRACLESIASQTVLPDEVIVVNNRSSDRTAEVAKSFPFVRIVSEPKKGLVCARNCGFDAATSDIIGRIDADSVLPPTWVQHVKAFYARPQNRSRAWSGNGYFHNVRLAPLVAWAYQFLAFRFNKLLLGHYTLWGSNMAVMRYQWQEVRQHVCDRQDIHEDLDLAIHIAEKGFGITYDPSVPVRAELRRVYADRHQLWEYLQWWPHTLKAHGNKSWVICWFVGAFLLYLATFVLLFLEVSGHFLEKSFQTLFAKKPDMVSPDVPRK